MFNKLFKKPNFPQDNKFPSTKLKDHLSREENDLVVQLLGVNCECLCTTVAQIFSTEAPRHCQWIKRQTGVLCFVKDSTKRSYYARMFCLMKHEMVWEQEIYDNIELSREKNYLITFEGEVRNYFCHN